MDNDYIRKIAVLDSDFAIRLGQAKFANVLEQVIPITIETLHIHDYVLSKEILYPQTVRQQLKSLVNSKAAILVNRESIISNFPERVVTYDDTVRHLRNYMKDTRPNGKNWGEILSLSYAKTIGVPYILSDELGLQNIVDEVLNLGDDEIPNPDDIKVIRISDFIKLMKASGGFERRFAKATWVACGLPAHTFDSDLWPKTPE